MAFVTRLCNPRGDDTDGGSGQGCSVPLLNSTLKPVPDGRSFPLFSSLPKELRLQVWEEATPRERLVHIAVFTGRKRDGDHEAPVRYLEKNHLGNPISGSGYVLIAEDGQLDHALLAVNKEARQVVLDFYRIHMPAECGRPSRSKTLPSHDERSVLRINPEHDVLQIWSEEPVRQTLIDFLWDLKAYDPKGVGLLRLATSLREFCYNDLQYLRRSDLLLIRQRQALVGSLAQLREVWFMGVEPGRDTYKRSGGGGGGGGGGPGGDMVPYGIRMSGYECVGPEARDGAGAELQRVYMGSVDPRELIWRWRRLLRKWGVHHPPGQVRYRVMVAQQQFACKDERGGGRGLGRLMGLLSLRDRGRDFFKAGSCEAGAGLLADQVRPDASGATRAAAVGFWSFPVEAVGELGEGRNLIDLDYEPNRVLDLRSHWPELLLAKMV